MPTYARGPVLLGIDPTSPSKPATVLDKFTHVDHLQRRSDYCFKVPAVSVPDNYKDLDDAEFAQAGTRSSSRSSGFVGYLQFDAEKRDVRDAWIAALNDEFARFLEDRPSSVLAVEVRQEQAKLEQLTDAAGKQSVRLSVKSQSTCSNRRAGQSFAVMFDTFAKEHGIDIAPALQHKLSGDLGRLADTAGTVVQNQHLDSHDHDLIQTILKSEKSEVALTDRCSDGSPVHYVWEASASGSIAGAQVFAESGPVHIGVQIRNLSGVLRDYDGEIAALRLIAGFDQDDVESEQASVVQAALGQASDETSANVQRLLTRMHEKFFLRKYKVPAWSPSLKPTDTICGYLRCRGRKGSESLFCSQFNAEVYQGMGLMSPAVDPSSVLPVDFLPSLALPGFPRFAREIIPLKMRKTQTKGQCLLAYEEESAARERWKLSCAAIGLTAANRFGERGGRHRMTRHLRVSAATVLQAQHDFASIVNRQSICDRRHECSPNEPSSLRDVESPSVSESLSSSIGAVRQGWASEPQQQHMQHGHDSGLDGATVQTDRARASERDTESQTERQRQRDREKTAASMLEEARLLSLATEQRQKEMDYVVETMEAQYVLRIICSVQCTHMQHPHR